MSSAYLVLALVLSVASLVAAAIVAAAIGDREAALALCGFGLGIALGCWIEKDKRK